MRRCIAFAAVVAGLNLACVIDILRDDDVGDAPACAAAARWPREYAELEDELLERINAARSAGGQCGESTRNPVQALVLSPALRCAARIHATDVAETGRLSHVGESGDTTLARVDAAEYDGVPKHELLAADFSDPAEVLEAWLATPAHCNGVLDSQIDEFGPGFAVSARGDARGWVLVTGEERE